MTSGCFLPRTPARAGVVLAGVGLLILLPGCGDAERYPDALEYPVRTDWIVNANPKNQPPAFDFPGRFPLDGLDALPRKFDSDRKVNVIDVEKAEADVQAGRLHLDAVQKAMLEEYKTNSSNLLDTKNLKPEERAELDTALRTLFGTPARPRVKAKGGEGDPLGVDPEIVKKLNLGEDTLAHGSRLYRNHCLHCHGLEGNGRGPTGPWLNPHPRDYRQGVFKYTSSAQDLGERKPRRDDLLRVLRQGIEGTSMPSFGILAAEDLDALASYVVHLSLRGESEYFVMQTLLQSGSVEGGIGAFMQTGLDVFIGRWADAQDKPITADPYPYDNSEKAMLESAARGSKLFNTGQASCVSCHKNYGREAGYYFDAWGTVVRPRDLINGFNRGGGRPVDLYNRVWAGISGAGMASYANELRPNDDDKAKKQDKIWDLVNFMQALHYPELRKKLTDEYGVKLD
jgi:mono/diheme cytochrome c family protein